MYDCNNKSQSRLIEHRASMKSISEDIVFTVKSEQSFRVDIHGTCSRGRANLKKTK